MSALIPAPGAALATLPESAPHPRRGLAHHEHPPRLLRRPRAPRCVPRRPAVGRWRPRRVPRDVARCGPRARRRRSGSRRGEAPGQTRRPAVARGSGNGSRARTRRAARSTAFACQGRRETRPKGGAKHCHRGRRGEMVRGGRDEAGGGVSRKLRSGYALPSFPAGGDAQVRSSSPCFARGCG